MAAIWALAQATIMSVSVPRPKAVLESQLILTKAVPIASTPPAPFPTSKSVSRISPGHNPFRESAFLIASQTD